MLKEIQLHLNKAGHMIFVTFPLIQEQRMLLTIFKEINLAVNKIILMLLKIEREKKMIPLYKDPRMNFRVFLKKVAPKYLISNEKEKIIEILRINKKHTLASLEFVRKDKFVIFDDAGYEILTIKKIKELYHSIDIIFKKLKEKI